MNIILLEAQDFVSENEVELFDRRWKHVREVLKSKIGDQLRVGLLDGLMGLGTVIELSAKSLRLRTALEQKPPPAIGLKVLVALPRPKVMQRLVHGLTQLGVKDIHFFHSYRVEKSFWSSDYLLPDKIQRACRLGLEQARDTVMPRVFFHRWFKPFVEDELPSLCQKRQKYLAHPHELQSTVNVSVGEVRTPAVLAIGPEGGLIDYEIDYFKKAEFNLLQIGSRVLKVEVATMALVSRFLK